MKIIRIFLLILSAVIILQGCDTSGPIPVIFDTDANNELDDQHALAYLLLNDEKFNTIGVTVNATRNGGEIQAHVKEARAGAETLQ